MRSAARAAVALLVACAPLRDGAADMYQDASNSKTETVFRFGTGLYPQYANAVTTTASATNGSPTITVANAAGISVGDMINNTSPSFTSGVGMAGLVWVANIAGNSITMSGPATSSQTGASITFGADRWAPGKTLMTDDIGARHGYFGAAAKGKSSWLGKYWSGADYPALHTVFALSESGMQAGMFGTRTSDGSGAGAITLGTLMVDDGSVLTTTWNNYHQSNLVGSVPGTHIQTESSVYSQWTPIVLDPYTPNRVGNTINLRLDCGVESGTPQDCTTPLHIINNGAAYRSGIIFGNNSVSNLAGGLSPAMELPKGYAIDWFSPSSPAPAGNRAWRLYSSATGGNSFFELGNNASVSVTGATPFFQFGAPGGHIGQVGMTDGANMTIDSLGGGVTLLNNGGSPKIRLDPTVTYFFQPIQGFKAQTYTVASLPTCNAAATYTIASVSDQSGSPTYRGTLTGGGSVKVLAMCNGTAWEAH